MFAQLNFDDALKEHGFLLEVNSSRVPVSFRQSAKARQYAIHVRGDGKITVTIPRRGSLKSAQRFLESRRAWIAKTLRRLRDRPITPKFWQAGTEVLWRGRRVPIRVETNESGIAIYLENEFCGVAGIDDNLRPMMERWLQGLATSELPKRVQELAAQHQSPVRRVMIRNQRSRWGSCSRRGTISLNWRLVQLPDQTRDYIILHELMHLREMNHSRRFWAHVASVCPEVPRTRALAEDARPILGL